MKQNADVCDKCTNELRDWLRTARDNDRTEVIVHLKDSRARERPGDERANWYDAEKKMKQRARLILDKFEESLSKLEDGDANIRVVTTSWIGPTAQVVASPEGIKTLSRRHDVELLNVNAPTALRLPL